MAIPMRRVAVPPPYHPRIADLSRLNPGWDGEGAPVPNEVSLRWATRLVEAAHGLEVEPNAVMACVDGGVSLLFARQSRKALIECFNEGDVTAVLADATGSEEAWMISETPINLTASVMRIRDFLAG
jgi:hypothetical protein